MKTIVVNGETYRLIEPGTETLSDSVLVRTYSAGVHVGKIKKREGKEVTLTESRRIWYWEGAATLSQLALEGTNKPEKCKFSVLISEITLTEAIEIMPLTSKACKSIYGVKEWKA